MEPRSVSAQRRYDYIDLACCIGLGRISPDEGLSDRAAPPSGCDDAESCTLSEMSPI